MSTETVRGYILGKIGPRVPADWKVEPGIPTLGTLSKPVLWVEYTAFEPFPEAPLSKIKASADLCIATNKTDVRKGEDEADESVAELYEAVIVSNTFYSITARKAVFNDAYVGWRMSIDVITTNPVVPEE
ncbi:hypothetical protein [Microbacterium oxydans]|uniref:hypothetical protein n=1 Tax=Microbacterium oxydans TaxID=82380 RepID=UPI0024ACA096|nr:hypothetical protein [Microbacterium oxydans]